MTTHEDLMEFESWVAESLEHSAPPSRTLKLVSDSDRGNASLLADLAELGILGAYVPESAGGLDVTPIMLQSLLRISGAQLLPTGLLSGCVVAPFILRAVADEHELLSSIAGGTKRVTWADQAVAVPARCEDGLITGEFVRVLDADLADTFIVTVGSHEHTQLYVVEAANAVVDTREPLDPTRPALSVSFTAAPARPLRVDNTARVAAQARRVLIFGLAAESAGLAKATLDRSVSYAQIREQFGRPIGSFQAIKHMSADMFVAAEGAAAGVELAARSWEARGELDEFEVLSTAAFAFRAARDNANAMMQIHGGLAFTWEHEAHWFLKRATSTPLIAREVNDAAVADLALHSEFDVVSALFEQ